jgi:hypothetical protein
MEIPHNTAAHLAVPFPTSAACRFLDLPPGSADPFSLKTVHWTVFRALEPSKPSKSAIASVEKFTRQLTTLIARYFLKELPHNTAAHLTVPFPPYASCKFLDLPPVSLRNLQARLAKNSLVS